MKIIILFDSREVVFQAALQHFEADEKTLPASLTSESIQIQSGLEADGAFVPPSGHSEPGDSGQLCFERSEI
jgi:hypothetical protein